jgi:GNAT superfamily N-acetyltransferase
VREKEPEWLILREAEKKSAARRKAQALLVEAGWADAGKLVPNVRILWLEDFAGTDEPIAAVAIEPVTPTSVRLLSTAVARSRREDGIHSKLLAELVDALRAEGIRQVLASPGDRGVRVDALASLGFNEIQRTEDGLSVVLEL